MNVVEMLLPESFRAIKDEWRTIVANSASLVLTIGVNSGLGFVFWWLAARQFTDTAVGFAAATISAMTLIGTIAMFGQGTLLIRELARRPGQEASLISSAVVLAGGMGAVLGAGFAMAAGQLSAELRPLAASWQSTLLFSVGVSLTAVALVLDEAVLGWLRGGVQLTRNIVFAMAKLLLLGATAVWLSERTGLVIYVVWGAGNLISLLMLLGFALRHGGLRRRLLPRLALLRQLGCGGLRHHQLNLSLKAPSLALALVVTAVLSAASNAYFYAAWMIVNLAFSPLSALATTLFALGARSPAIVTHRLRLTLGLGAVVAATANVALAAAAPLMLRAFGASYTQAAACLQILAFGALPMLVKSHYVAITRIQDRLNGAAAMAAAGAVAELLLATIGAELGGLSGLACGWLLAVVIEAGFMAPVVYSVARGREKGSDRTVSPSASPPTTATLGRRIHIIGVAGTGKTTLGRRLGERLQMPSYELDRVGFEQGNWAHAWPLEVRQRQLLGITAQPGWVTEGVFLWWNREVLESAESILWLDHLTFPVVARRILRRATREAWMQTARADQRQSFVRRLRWVAADCLHTVLGAWNFYADGSRPAPQSPQQDWSTRATMANELSHYREKVIHIRDKTQLQALFNELGDGEQSASPSSKASL